MSLLDEMLETAEPQLKALFDSLPKTFLEGFSDFEGASSEAVEKVEGHMRAAAGHRLQAFQASDLNDRRMWADVAADELERAKVVMASEITAVSNEVAESILAGFSAVLDAVGSVAKGLIVALASGIASGAISSLTGGAEFDLSGVFPGA